MIANIKRTDDFSKEFKNNMDDVPFEIKLDEGPGHAPHIKGVERGQWKRVAYDAPGFCITGFGGEDFITVTYSPGQHGGTIIHAILCSCDASLRTFTLETAWADLDKGITLAMNEIYFQLF